MEYTSTLETLEGFSSALGRDYKHQIGALFTTMSNFWDSLTFRESQELLIVVNKASGSLLVDSSACHNYIDGIHDYSRYPLKFLECSIHVFRTLS